MMKVLAPLLVRLPYTLQSLFKDLMCIEDIIFLLLCLLGVCSIICIVCVQGGGDCQSSILVKYRLSF